MGRESVVDPIISIIVPIYNVEEYLNRCIDSILNQSFTNFELVLINDGSTDRCGEICDEYAKKDKRIRVIHKKNEGLSAARNKGIDNARGEYLGFVDSDDYIHPQMYEILLRAMKNEASDITICKFIKVYDKEYDYINFKVNDKMECRSYTSIEALDFLNTVDGIDFVIACNKLYKKSIFDDIRYPINKINEDSFVAHKVLYKSNKIAYINRDLYYYQQRNGSITNSGFSEKSVDRLYYNIERIKFFDRINQKEMRKRAEKEFIFNFFYIYFKLKYETNIELRELKNLKKEFVYLLRYILSNKNISIKEKTTFLFFLANDNLYYKYINLK